jgi:Ca2+-binding EF-hand superfamily protein
LALLTLCLLPSPRRSDTNHNGALSLAEVDQGLRVIFGGEAQAVIALSPAVTRAFHAAKEVKQSERAGAGETVSKAEFRLLLVYLKKYFELLEMFDAVDTSEDRRIDLKEFQSACPLLLQWGVAVPDPEREFNLIDRSHGGVVLFDEFAGWALKQSLDKDASDNVEGEGSLAQHHQGSSEVAAKAAAATAERMKQMDARNKPEANARDRSAGIDLDKLRGKLPTANSEQHVARRAEIFRSFDFNSNGALSMSELETGLRTLLDAKQRKDRSGRSIADALSPAIARAFHAAKDAKKGRGGLEDDEVNRSEFRLFLVALKRYSELLALFDVIDLSDDRRIEFAEFKAALPILRQWGVAVPDPVAEFTRMDANGGGMVLFDEFSGWALSRGADNDARDNVPGEDELANMHKAAGVSPRHSPRRRAAPSRKWQEEQDLPSMILALPCNKTEGDARARRELFADYFDPVGALASRAASARASRLAMAVPPRHIAFLTLVACPRVRPMSALRRAHSGWHGVPVRRRGRGGPSLRPRPTVPAAQLGRGS